MHHADFIGLADASVTYVHTSVVEALLADEWIQGIYGVTVDGGEKQYFSGFSATDSFQQILFATTNLQEADHNVVVTNENARNIQQYPSYVYLDIDFVSFTGTA